ncbi:MAG: cytochrome d ubiquinol oxidase subunit II, partial [Solirubrobacteraceae bacterium]
PGDRGDAIREHAHHSMAPVWEANHVWLIFVLTVTWTAYPVYFGSVASTLAIPFFLAALGIILRGASYALRSGASGRRELVTIDGAFAIASLITPFALGTVVGGIASERVPVGNAAGNLISSWLNPTSILIGVLAVVSSGYLAAVYLSADAARVGDSDIAEAFRIRALGAGLVAGAVALIGLVVLHGDAHSLFEELLHGAALVALIASVLAGSVTLGLVWSRRFEASRYTAALAVATVVAGWAFARYPVLLPGLDVHQAAASHDTMVTLILAVIGGAIILFPSLGLLFSLTLRGRFDPHSAGGGGGVALDTEPGGGAGSPLRTVVAAAGGPRLGPRVAGALLVAGFGMLNIASAGWAHAIGVVCLFAFMVLSFALIVPRALAEDA